MDDVRADACPEQPGQECCGTQVVLRLLPVAGPSLPRRARSSRFVTRHPRDDHPRRSGREDLDVGTVAGACVGRPAEQRVVAGAVVFGGQAELAGSGSGWAAYSSVNSPCHDDMALPGSVVTRMMRCGKRSCRYRQDPPQLPGPYIQWTRTVDGKTVTKLLTPKQLDRYQPWLDNARQLRELLSQLEDLSVQAVEHVEGWGANTEPRSAETEPDWLYSAITAIVFPVTANHYAIDLLASVATFAVAVLPVARIGPGTLRGTR